MQDAGSEMLKQIYIYYTLDLGHRSQWKYLAAVEDPEISMLEPLIISGAMV